MRSFFVCEFRQAQGASKLIGDRGESPYDDFFREISQSVHRIAEKVQLRLSEVDVHVDKYIDSVKDHVEMSNEHVQEVIQKVSFDARNFRKPEPKKKKRKIRIWARGFVHRNPSNVLS